MVMNFLKLSGQPGPRSFPKLRRSKRREDWNCVSSKVDSYSRSNFWYFHFSFGIWLLNNSTTLLKRSQITINRYVTRRIFEFRINLNNSISKGKGNLEPRAKRWRLTVKRRVMADVIAVINTGSRLVLNRHWWKVNKLGRNLHPHA